MEFNGPLDKGSGLVITRASHKSGADVNGRQFSRLIPSNSSQDSKNADAVFVKDLLRDTLCYERAFVSLSVYNFLVSLFRNFSKWSYPVLVAT